MSEYPFKKLRTWMSEVADKPGLTPSDRLVFVVIATHVNDAGECFPSDSKLAEKTGLKPISHVACRQRLRDAGVLEWSRTNGSTNRYRILVGEFRTSEGHDDLAPASERSSTKPRPRQREVEQLRVDDSAPASAEPLAQPAR